MDIDPVNNPLNHRFGLFYVNKDDDRIILRKSNKQLGWTINFGRPGGYLVLVICIAIPFLIAALRQYMQ